MEETSPIPVDEVINSENLPEGFSAEILPEISEVTEIDQKVEPLGSIEEALETQTEAIPAELPDWLTENLSEPSSESVVEIPLTPEGKMTEPFKLSEESPIDTLAEISEITEEVLKEELPISIEEGLHTQPDATPADLPDWLSDFSAPVIQPMSDLPDLTPVENLPAEPTDNLELPDWLAGLDQPVPSEPEPQLQEQDSIELVSETPTIPEAVESVIEETASEPIEPLQAEFEEPPLSEITAPVSVPTVSEPEIPEQIGEPIPSIAQFDEDSQAPTRPVNVRLSSTEPTEEVKIDDETSIVEVIPSEEIETVFEEASGIDTILEPPVQPAEEIPTELVTDSLVQTTEEIAVEPIAEAEVQPIAEIASEPVLESTVQPAEEMPTDLEAALAWMEALAARQGADDSTLSIAPEERSAEMPDWLQQEVDNATESPIPPLPVNEDVEGEIIPEIEGEIQPVIEQIVEPSVDTLSVESAPLPSEEIVPPSEIEQLISTAELEETPAQEETSETSEWLQTFHVDEAEAVTAEFELPDWLKGVEESTESIEPLPETKESKEEWVREETMLKSPESLPVDIPVSEISTEQIVSESDATSEIGTRFHPEEAPLYTESTPKELLEQAQIALRHNDVNLAVNHYEELVNSGNLIDETIHDLREAIDRYPMETPLYQILGDAYMRSNRLQDAIDAYTKAEQLLR